MAVKLISQLSVVCSHCLCPFPFPFLPVLTYVHVSAVIWRSHKYPIGAKCLRVEGQKVRPGVVSPQLTPDPVVAVAPVEVVKVRNRAISEQVLLLTLRVLSLSYQPMYQGAAVWLLLLPL